MSPFTPWTPYSGTWTAFSGEGLAKAGTQVELTGLNGETRNGMFLIGDINELGGFCDDCTDIIHAWQDGHHMGGKGPTMVVRYRRLVDESDYIKHVATICITETL